MSVSHRQIGPLLLGLFAGAAVGLAAPPSPRRLDRYSAGLALVERQAVHQSLEPIYRQGLAAVAELRPGFESYATASWRQPGYAPADHFAPQLAKLRGFSLTAYEGSALLLRPQLGFWQELATRAGQPADQQFFALSLRQLPDGQPLPAFVQQRTDYGGCYRYGSGLLVALYRDWRRYQVSFPGHYRELVAASLATVQAALAVPAGRPICSCDGPPGYGQELALFVAQLPADPLAVTLRRRQQQLADARAAPRFHCDDN